MKEDEEISLKSLKPAMAQQGKTGIISDPASPFCVHTDDNLNITGSCEIQVKRRAILNEKYTKSTDSNRIENDYHNDNLEPIVAIRETDDRIDLNMSLDTEPEVEYVLECYHCQKAFGTKRQLRRHMKMHTSASMRPYACGICDKRYRRACDARAHKRSHSAGKEMSCDTCGLTTLYRSTMIRHRKAHASDYKYRCDVCGAGFHVRTWWLDHANSHTGVKPYECEECDAAFACLRYLTVHTKEAHGQGGEAAGRCPFCKRTFTHARSLRRHVRRHTGCDDGKWLCDVCGRALASRDHLDVHRRVHTGERPYMCPVCGKAFAKKCNLVSHERIHSGERPFTCEVCDRQFIQRSSLARHRRQMHATPTETITPKTTA